MRFLVLAVIIILAIIAFTLGRKSESGRLIDLEPDQAESDKWSSKTVDADEGPVEARAWTGGKGAKADDDVIDLNPEDIEEL